MDIFKDLENPSVEYRSIPFWSWNDKLDPDMLREQIREMKKAGLGGYFMHARGGLQTEYLSDDWMNCINACVEEGKKLGMNSWFYDENGWPSGFADGVVPAMGEKYHVKWLEIEELAVTNKGEVEKCFSDSAVLGIYILEEDTNQIKRIMSQTQIKIFSKIYIIKNITNQYYIDILNKDTIKEFINATHEKYYQQFGEDFGNGILGFFTDEPQFSRGEIPWSHILPQEIQDKFGYDILDYLPALFIQSKGYEKIRYDFWSTVSSLYVSAFGQQIFNWCEEHNCQLTGHVMNEDNLDSQMQSTAGAMPFYEYMHTPGMDWLGRQISSPIIPKQVSSVANQLGKKQVISETFALCGWNVNFEELKWIAEWQYVNGVNLMCQHLEGYTLRGLRKRDYPPSLFYQQSWWKEYSHFNDYFARLGMLLTTGNAVAKVLLIHPIKSAWIAYNHSDNLNLAKLDEDFRNASEMLSSMHIDHHYGDETLINKHGSVNEGSLLIGQCSYQVVILPSMLSIDYKTLELLNTFINNGGKVLSVGEFPKLCEGEYSNSVTKLSEKVLHQKLKLEIYNTLAEANIPSISIFNQAGEIADIHYCERDLTDRNIFFIVNHSNQLINADIKINETGLVKKLSLESIEFTDIEQTNNGNQISFKLQFEPMQSHILVVEKNNSSLVALKKDQKLQTLPLVKSWAIEKMGLNSLTLDYCYYSIDNGAWEGPIHTINLMGLLLDRQCKCEIALKFDFTLEMNLQNANEMYLAIEDANEFEININGESLNSEDLGWWKDSSFKKVDIRAAVHAGQNIIILKRNFYQSQKVYDVLFGENVLETEKNKLTYDVELESIYVVGDFGVVSTSDYTYGERTAIITKGPFVITDKPVILDTGSFTEQGLCFFSDAITISQTVNVTQDGTHYLLDYGKPDACMSKVYINDLLVTTILWAPYQFDVTDYLKNGENKISITLYASNRNLLGPHHNILGESYSVGPSTFTANAGWSEPGNQGPKNMWTDTYCFVKFGL